MRIMEAGMRTAPVTVLVVDVKGDVERAGIIAAAILKARKLGTMRTQKAGVQAGKNIELLGACN